MTDDLVVVVAGGDPAPAPLASLLASLVSAIEPAAVVAADSGVDHARSLGLVPSLVVGDLDSISVEGLAWIDEIGTRIHRHPEDKDATDLELAIGAAVQLGTRVLVIDNGSGRLDHALGNLTLLASPRFASVHVTGIVGAALVGVVHDLRHLWGAVGSTVSLLPMGGAASGVTTTGLRWPLADATLVPGTSWGLSNRFVRPDATVAVDTGVVVVVQPQADPSALAAALSPTS